jgi:hypothetical protein
VSIHFQVMTNLAPGAVNMFVQLVDCLGRPRPMVDVIVTTTDGFGTTVRTDASGNATVSVSPSFGHQSSPAEVALFGTAVQFDVINHGDEVDSLIVLLRSQQNQSTLQGDLLQIVETHASAQPDSFEETLKVASLALARSNAITFAARELNVDTSGGGMGVVSAVGGALAGG